MHVAGNEHFLAPCPTIPSFGKRYDRRGIVSKIRPHDWKKAKIQRHTTLKTHLFKSQNHSTNSALWLVESRDAHRLALGREVKFPLTVCCEFSLLTEPPRSREIDKITEFADIARENAHFQQHAWGYISLLKINWRVAMIELCLWSKKTAIR